MLARRPCRCSFCIRSPRNKLLARCCGGCPRSASPCIVTSSLSSCSCRPCIDDAFGDDSLMKTVPAIVPRPTCPDGCNCGRSGRVTGAFCPACPELCLPSLNEDTSAASAYRSASTAREEYEEASGASPCGCGCGWRTKRWVGYCVRRPAGRLKLASVPLIVVAVVEDAWCGTGSTGDALF